jgi:hypothetical protein
MARGPSPSASDRGGSILVTMSMPALLAPGSLRLPFAQRAQPHAGLFYCGWNLPLIRGIILALPRLAIDGMERAMPAEESYCFRLPRDQRRRTDLPPLRALKVDSTPCRHGYLAGWRSVRDDQPVLIPPSPVFVGPVMYMVGFSRGARDTGEKNP